MVQSTIHNDCRECFLITVLTFLVNVSLFFLICPYSYMNVFFEALGEAFNGCETYWFLNRRVMCSAIQRQAVVVCRAQYAEM